MKRSANLKFTVTIDTKTLCMISGTFPFEEDGVKFNSEPLPDKCSPRETRVTGYGIMETVNKAIRTAERGKYF